MGKAIEIAMAFYEGIWLNVVNKHNNNKVMHEKEKSRPQKTQK
jgi:hypothetical protein